MRSTTFEKSCIAEVFNEKFIKMGQIHYRVKQVSLDDILQTALILLVSSMTIREETIKERNAKYKIFIKRYVIEECIRGDFDKGASIDVLASNIERMRQAAKDAKLGISRHSIELACQAPARDYPYEKDRCILLLNSATDRRGIYTHRFHGLTLAVGWRDELLGKR